MTFEWTDNILAIKPVPWFQKQNEQLAVIKNENFCSLIDSVKIILKTDSEKLCATYIANKGLLYKIYDHSLNSAIRKYAMQ